MLRFLESTFISWFDEAHLEIGCVDLLSGVAVLLCDGKEVDFPLGRVLCGARTCVYLDGIYYRIGTLVRVTL